MKIVSKGGLGKAFFWAVSILHLNYLGYCLQAMQNNMPLADISSSAAPRMPGYIGLTITVGGGDPEPLSDSDSLTNTQDFEAYTKAQERALRQRLFGRCRACKAKLTLPQAQYCAEACMPIEKTHGPMDLKKPPFSVFMCCVICSGPRGQRKREPWCSLHCKQAFARRYVEAVILGKKNALDIS